MCIFTADVRLCIGFQIIQVLDTSTHHIFAAQFQTNIVVHDDLQGGVCFEPVCTVLSIHQFIVEINVFLNVWMPRYIIFVNGLYIFSHRFTGNIAPDRSTGDVAAYVAANNTSSINAWYVGACIKADINAALCQRIVVGTKFYHALMQIYTALVEVIGDGVDAFAFELLMLISVVFFAVAGAVHEGWAGCTFKAFGKDAWVDIHERITALTVWFIAEWADGVAVDVTDNAKPGCFTTAGKALDTSMTIWNIDVNQFCTCTISDGSTASSRWAAMGVKDVGWVNVWIHAHGLSCRYEHSFCLDNNHFWFVICKDEPNCTNRTAFIIGQDVVDEEFIHDLRAVFTCFVGQYTFLVGAIVFQMIALAGWHGMSFKVVFASRLHVDAPFFPAFYNALGAQHHLAQHGLILPWATFHAFVDF